MYKSFLNYAQRTGDFYNAHRNDFEIILIGLEILVILIVEPGYCILLLYVDLLVEILS